MEAEEIFIKLQALFPGLVKSDTRVGAVSASGLQADDAPVNPALSPSGGQSGGAKDYPSWTVPAQSVRAVCERLRSKFSFDYLDLITAVDRPASASPAAATAAPAAAGGDVFELVYLVSVLSTGVKICLRCEIPRAAPASVPSLYGIFMAADWQEREVYDLFGIHFEGHPNLKRILTPETQLGYPLRKDYVHVPDAYD